MIRRSIISTAVWTRRSAREWAWVGERNAQANHNINANTNNVNNNVNVNNNT